MDITKKIDELGRITLPKALRQKLDFVAGSTISISELNGGILLRKAGSFCPICNKNKELIKFSDEVQLCKDCYKQIKSY